LRAAKASAIALLIVFAGSRLLSAHRLDEYLQASRISVEPGRLEVDIDLTPGVAVASRIVRDIDRDADGRLSADEQRGYAAVVIEALRLQVDGQPVRARLVSFAFPELDALRRGDATIELKCAADMPPLASGQHRIFFENQHHRDVSVYLANALVPQDDRVAIVDQLRDGSQQDLTIVYRLRGGDAWFSGLWVFGLLSVAIVTAFLIRHDI
jgi:hypothetical protein